MIATKKSLGQHFLVTPHLQKLIAHDHCAQAEAIIEIGPGAGALTQHLARLEKPLFLIEKDDRLIEGLVRFTRPEHICHHDALAIDWPSFIDQHNLQGKVLWLVSNLPYNISVPLYMSFTRTAQFKYLTLMFQKEVGRKLLPLAHGKKSHNEMSSLAVITATYFQTKELALIAPGHFRPAPAVESVVLSFERRPDPIIALDALGPFEQFLMRLFAHRRKQLQKVLKISFPEMADPSILERRLQQAQLDPQQRAESLTLAQVYQLYRTF